MKRTEWQELKADVKYENPEVPTDNKNFMYQFNGAHDQLKGSLCQQPKNGSSHTR